MPVNRPRIRATSALRSHINSINKPRRTVAFRDDRDPPPPPPPLPVVSLDPHPLSLRPDDRVPNLPLRLLLPLPPPHSSPNHLPHSQREGLLSLIPESSPPHRTACAESLETPSALRRPPLPLKGAGTPGSSSNAAAGPLPQSAVSSASGHGPRRSTRSSTTGQPTLPPGAAPPQFGRHN